MSIEVLDTSYQARQKKIKSKPLRKEKTMRIKVFLVSIFICTVNIYSLIHVNDIREVFDDVTESISIENKIVLGSTHFLRSKAYVSFLLSEVEKSSNGNFDFLVTEDHLKKAKDNLSISLWYFKNALVIGKRIAYSEDKKVLFQTFNYDQFISTNNMIEQIANKVKSFLIKNDVIGVYQENVNNLEKIFNIIVEIELKIDKRIQPDLTTFWSLYQAYSEAALFGNYATMMGRKILNNDSAQ